MAIHRSLRLSATRRNTLAACLAAALAAGEVGAADSTSRSIDATRMHAIADDALFGSHHTKLMNAARNWKSNAAMSPSFNPSAHPTGSSITVGNCEDDGSADSLRGAFARAQDGDTIDLSALTCSTITLLSGAIAVDVPNILVRGPGQDALTIDGGLADSVFVSKYNGLEVTDLTIARGDNDGGLGGCISVNGDLTLTRSTVTDCHSGNGSNTVSHGGAVQTGGNLRMYSSTISFSSATASDHAYGGGAYVAGSANVEFSTIEGNIATTTSDSSRGGGLFAKGVLYAVRSRVIDNFVVSTDGTAFGGGIDASSSLGMKVILSLVSGNAAHSETGWSDGGGIHGNELVLGISTLSGNTASANCADCLIIGGGACVFGEILSFYSTIRDNQVLSAPNSAGTAAGGGLASLAFGNSGRIGLRNSTMSGNRAMGGENQGGSGYGGGMAAISSSPFLAINSTIAFNKASHFGGGATGNVDETHMPTLYSSIVANNEAPVGVANDLAAGAPFGLVNIAGTNNLVMVASADIAFSSGEPLHDDPDLLPLSDDNGGFTATHALEVGSPAVDTGNQVDDEIVYDQRFCPYARKGGTAADIGAFEMQTETPDHAFGDGFDALPLCP